MFVLTITIYFDFITVHITDKNFHTIEAYSMASDKSMYHKTIKLVENFIQENTYTHQHIKFHLKECGYYFNSNKS